MMKANRNHFFLRVYILFFLCILTTLGCRHTSSRLSRNEKAEPGELEKREIQVVFMPEKARVPAHLIYSRTDHYSYDPVYKNKPFIIDFTINPLMRNPTIVARIEKNGSVQRQFLAKKTAVNVLSDKKNTWSPIKSQLSLAIPFLTEGEEVKVTTTYEWMDIRWLPPIFLHEKEFLTREASLVVDVPFGVAMRFKASINGADYGLVPTNTPQERSIWVTEDNPDGVGMRYLWHGQGLEKISANAISELLQVFLAFDNPAKHDNRLKFDSWNAISRYLYNRIDRYDLPSEEIRKFAQKETRDFFEVEDRCKRLLGFLRDEVESRTVTGSYHDQDVQPATKTFETKSGSRLDKAILGKALFTSIGVKADLVAIADKTINPKVSDIFSPALFNSVILAVEIHNQRHYFDPEEAFDLSFQLEPNVQGQHALLLRPNDGLIVSLPFATARHNMRDERYHLWLTKDGLLEGQCSVDLTGFERSKFDELSETEQKNMTPAQIERQFSNRLPFSLQSAQIASSPESDQRLTLFGNIKPSLLAKNEDGAFLLDLGALLKPTLEALKDASKKSYSSINRIALAVNIPDSVNIKTLPPPVNIQVEGIDARFFAYFTNGQLVIEGMSMISLPIVANSSNQLSGHMEKLRWFVDQPLLIAESSKVMEEIIGEQQPKMEEVP